MMELHEVLAKVDRDRMNGPACACLDQLILCVEAQDWSLVAHQAQLMVDIAKECVDQREARDWGTLVLQVASIKWHGDGASLRWRPSHVALRRHVEWMMLRRDRDLWNGALVCLFAGLADPRLSLSMFATAIALFDMAAARFAERGDYDRCVEAHDLLNWCEEQIIDEVAMTYVDAAPTLRTSHASAHRS